MVQILLYQLFIKAVKRCLSFLNSLILRILTSPLIIFNVNFAEVASKEDDYVGPKE